MSVSGLTSPGSASSSSSSASATVAGTTPFQNAAVTNAAVAVKPSAAGNLYGYNISNPTAVLVYLQFFDVATAGAVTVGTTAPKFWLGVPANSGVTDGWGGVPVSFANGMIIAATTTPTGAGAPTTALPVSLFYA